MGRTNWSEESMYGLIDSVLYVVIQSTVLIKEGHWSNSCVKVKSSSLKGLQVLASQGFKSIEGWRHHWLSEMVSMTDAPSYSRYVLSVDVTVAQLRLFPDPPAASFIMIPLFQLAYQMRLKPATNEKVSQQASLKTSSDPANIQADSCQQWHATSRTVSQSLDGSATLFWVPVEDIAVRVIYEHLVTIAADHWLRWLRNVRSSQYDEGY